MANPSKAKGTREENVQLVLLQRLWPGASRSSTNEESNDFHGIPFPVECKKRDQWNVKTWVKKLRKVSEDGLWLLLISDRDVRSKDSAGKVMVLPQELGYRALEALFAEGAA